MRRFQRWIKMLVSQAEPLISTMGVLGLLGCLGLIWIIATLVEDVWEKETFQFDTTFLLWIHQLSNPVVDQVMLVMTQLGNPQVVLPTFVVVCIVLLRDRQYSEAKFFVIACVGGTILNNGLKLAFSKPRPALWKQLIVETTYSFPSGHALGSVVLYGAIAYLAAAHYPRFSGLIYGGAIGLVGLIGVSRLYLGVHWLTDIIAGYSMGLLWLMICLGLLNLQRQKVSG
jgi:membrane-associated phospholipid phosphatase